jgi:Tfp pilus assembly protein PilF
MSLLMEALKKAEEARRQTEGKDAPAAGGEAPAPPSDIPSLGPPADPLPNLSSRFDAPDARFTAASPAPLSGRPAPDAWEGDVARERAAARKVFAAKRPESVSALGWIAGAGFFALLGVGGYFWWQVRAIESPGIVRPTAASSAIAAPAAAAPALATPAMPPAVAAPLVSSPPTEASVPTRPIREAAPPPVEKHEALAPASTVSPPLARTPAATATAVDSPRQPADAAVELRFTQTVPQANPALERAYDALQAGRDDEAQRAYAQALRADGKNADALLGLATLAARQGRSDAAHAYYLRALEADPSDATARAGVFSTGGHGDEAAAESRLKTALARAPDSPPLNFALGSLYARQQRWSEAQQAYFRAYTGDPGNPDLIFNLAVSLDHLRQGRLAAQYYRMALDAGEVRAASFARERVDARLRELAKTAE